MSHQLPRAQSDTFTMHVLVIVLCCVETFQNFIPLEQKSLHIISKQTKSGIRCVQSFSVCVCKKTNTNNEISLHLMCISKYIVFYNQYTQSYSVNIRCQILMPAFIVLLLKIAIKLIKNLSELVSTGQPSSFRHCKEDFDSLFFLSV